MDETSGLFRACAEKGRFPGLGLRMVVVVPTGSDFFVEEELGLCIVVRPVPGLLVGDASSSE